MAKARVEYCVPGTAIPRKDQRDIYKHIEDWAADMAGAQDMRDTVWPKYKRQVVRMVRESGWNWLDDMNAAGIRSFIGSLNEGGASSQTRLNYNSSIRSFLQFLKSTGRKTPALVFLDHPLKIRKEEGGDGMRALSFAEVQALIHVAIRCEEEYKGKSQRSDRPLYYAALFVTGLRRRESRGVRWCDANLEADPPCITVPANVSKSRAKRDVILTRWLADAILRTRGDADAADPIFGAAPHTSTLKKDAERAGLIVDGVGWHSFRKGSVTEIQRLDVDLAAMQAGHADTRITERHYTDKKIALSQKLERVTLDIDRGKDDSGGVTHEPHTSEQREGAPIANRASQHQRRGAPSVVRGDSPYSHGPAGDAAGRGTANAGGGTRTPTDTCDESVRDQAGDAPSFDAVTEVVQQYLRFALASLAQRSRRDGDPDS